MKLTFTTYSPQDFLPDDLSLPNFLKNKICFFGRCFTITPKILWPELNRRIANLAMFILKTVVGSVLYCMNPSLFAIGFLASIYFDKEVKSLFNKINTIWQKQPWKVMFIVGTGAGLSLPITMAAASTLFAARLGSELSLESARKARKSQYSPNQTDYGKPETRPSDVNG